MLETVTGDFSVQHFHKGRLCMKAVYLSLDHSLWNGIHGIIEPTFQAFGKVANGLSQGT